MSDGRIPMYSKTPNRAWEILRSKQKVKKVEPLAHSAPKPPGHTRFVCISGKNHMTTVAIGVPGIPCDCRVQTLIIGYLETSKFPWEMFSFTQEIFQMLDFQKK